jgi:hypothetical protein
MCYPCYQLWLKKNPNPTKLTDIGKVCTRCKKDKPLSAYNKTKRNSSGLDAHCRECSKLAQVQWRKNNPDKGKEYDRKWKDNNAVYLAQVKPDYLSTEYRKNTQLTRGWAHFLKKTYRLSPKEFYALLESQDGGCAICGRKDSGVRNRQMHLDHCHETGRNRGILCHSCNVGLGNFKNNPDRLFAAAAYLLQYVNVLSM